MDVMPPLEFNGYIAALLLGAMALGAILSGIWRHISLRKLHMAYRDMDRELGRTQASAEHLREQLDDTVDHLHAKERDVRSVSVQLQQLQQQYVELQTIHKEKQAHFHEMQQSLDQARAQMKLEFQNLANRILDEKGKVF